MNKSFNRSILAIALLLLAGPGRSQTFEAPSIEGERSFAVVIDDVTLDRCRSQVGAYKQVLEEEGLPVFVVSDHWQSPEEVRRVLVELHASNGLEGCVFVGEIPIAMITRAQHLTSAFKMNEYAYDIHEVSVPSDRFYDDFDLKFVAQGTPADGLFHYYELAPDSPQYISCDIYSGRIKAQKAFGDPYAQIARYLEKVVREHRAATPFDRFVSYTGHGSYSNSLVAWRDEQMLLDEQFGDTFRLTHGAKFLRYSMQPFMKSTVIRELRRDDLDMMVFHEHGMPDRQYLSGPPYVASAEEAVHELGFILRERARRSASSRRSALHQAAERGLDTTWYCAPDTPEQLRTDSIADLRSGIILEEVPDIAPNARFVIFDACYNGDYREDDFIAGHYIFSGGRCVTTFANSVNVLQDKSAFDLLGLLGEGLRIGAWARNIHILESHIIGDPTYRFVAAHTDLEINDMAANSDADFWLARLDHEIPDVQNLAMIRLWENNCPGLSDILLDKMKHSPYAIVRYNAFRLLESLGGTAYREALCLAAYDRFEFLRRVAVNRMGRVGDERFIPILVDVYAQDRNAARIVFNIGEAVQCFDKEKMKQAVEEYFADKSYFHADSLRQELLRKVENAKGLSQAEEALADLRDPQTSESMKLLHIAFLKNRPYNQKTDELLALLRDPAQPQLLRTRLAESLAWFNLSVHREQIVRAGRDLLSQEGLSPAFRKELVRMVNRLESKK